MDRSVEGPDAPEADGGYVDEAADAPEPTIAAGLRSLKPWSALFAFGYLPLSDANSSRNMRRCSHVMTTPGVLTDTIYGAPRTPRPAPPSEDHCFRN